MMIEQFFLSFGIFSKEEIAGFLPLFEQRQLPKSSYFAQEGQVCREVAFIESGIFRSYYHTEKGDDVTYCFRFPNGMLGAYSSFISGGPSVENLQALTEARIWVLTKKKIEDLEVSNSKWTKFLKIIAEQQYMELEERVFQLQKESASSRYASLLKKQPDYIQSIPLQYLSSYLGITQRHLSRIRKSLSF